MSISVQPGDFEDVVTGLTGLVNEMNEAASAVTRHDPSVVGHPQLVDAVTQFTTAWSAELRSLETTLGELQSRLQAAQSVYAEADTAVSQAFRTGRLP